VAIHSLVLVRYSKLTDTLSDLAGQAVEIVKVWKRKYTGQ